MFWEIVVCVIMIVTGLIAGFWNPGHLLYTVLPGAVLLWAAITEHRKEKQRKNTYKR